MEELDFSIQGIYDQRTLKFLIQEGIKNFGFDFDPKSFNFIQEYVFLDLYKSHLTDANKIILKFNHSNDVMIEKLLNDLKNIRPNLNNIIFLFNEVDANFQYPYFLIYHNKLKIEKHQNFEGIYLGFEFIERNYDLYTLKHLYSNLIAKNPLLLNKKIVLNLNWRDNLISSLFDFIEISEISFSINSDVEICYRNVDQQKVKRELNLKKNYIGF